MPPSTGLLTDHYELTMLRAALADGTAHRPCVFQAFTRSLPGRRRYGVLAGVGRLVDALARFRYDDGQIAWLLEADVVDGRTAEHLRGWRPRVDVDAMAEGEAFFPDEPVLVARGTFADAVLLETLVLSVLNADSAVASAAARMVRAARGRPCVEFGSRRTHEEAAVAAARAAYVAGFAATSNLAAGHLYGVPTTGTSAHAFVLLHDDEASAFRGQVAALGESTTLLVDTYDTVDGVRRAVEAVGPGLGAVRLDSGDLGDLAHRARQVLDEHGAHDARVLVTSDLDEHAIAGLADAPVDGYGVGTQLVTGSGQPTLGFVYKLVARARGAEGPLEPVAKTSSRAKATRGGRTWAARRHDADGVAVADQVTRHAPAARDDLRPLLVPLLRGGEPVADLPDLEAARAHCRAALDALPPQAFSLQPGDPALPVEHLDG